MIKKDSLNVLDVGAGTGNLALKFLASGNNVTAIDISEEMLNVLSGKVPINFKDSIELVCTDVDEFLLRTRQQYDVICFSSVLHHLPDYFHTLDLAISKLGGGSVIYITHEPLPRLSGRGFVHRNIRRVLGLINSYLYRLRLAKYSKLKFPNLNYSISDIHSKEGINTEELLEFFEHKDMKIVSYNEYVSYKSGVLSIIGNFLLVDSRHFKLIAKKKETP